MTVDAPATSSFKSPLRCEDNADGTRTLLEPFRYELSFLGSKAVIEVPAGYRTDGASIPGLVQWLLRMLFGIDLTPWDKHYAKCCVLHDHCYDIGVSRIVSDAVLYEACMVNHCPRWKASIIWLGVACFGWWAYGQHRRRDRQEKNND